MSGVIGPGHPDFWDPAAFLPQWKVRAKHGNLVPFQLWTHQLLLAAAVRRCYAEDKWLVHVKPRQEGSSTFFTGIATQHAMYRVGCRAALLAHKKDTAKSLSEIAIRFYQSTPQAIQPRKTLGLKRTLEFPQLDSKMTIASVRDEEPLRGDTVQVLLATEVSSWEENGGPEAWTSALNAVPRDGGFVIAESTPKYHGDQLHVLCNDAEQPGSRWLKVFIPWTLVEEYRVRPPVGWRPPKEVLDYANTNGLTEEQAFWLQTEGLPRCANDFSKFRAEYPVNELDCWVLAGESVFPQDPLMARAKELDGGTGLTVETKAMETWAGPERGKKYVITCDPASSWSKKDMFGVQVLSVDDCEQVAEYLGHADAYTMAKMLIGLSAKYNNARLYVEANGVGDAVLSHLIALGCRNVYWRNGGNGHSRAPGWYNTAKSKAESISILHTLIQDGSLRLHSMRCIRQLLNYRGQWDKLDRDAQGGHFDLVASMAIAAWAWRQEAGRGFQSRQMTDREKADQAWRRILRVADAVPAGSQQGDKSPWGTHR
jgi:hypothetical protein